MPLCRTTDRRRSVFDDGPPRRWADAQTGQPRAACVFQPPGAGPGSPRPLLLFVHGSGGSADLTYNHTSVRAKAATYDLTGDPARPGFLLVSDQGWAAQNANGNPPATRRDLYYRDLGVPSRNADYRNMDRLIDELVAQGAVDRRRIYLAGWSNGAYFAVQYGLARHTTPTPAGNRVAAVAIFDGADPFRAPRADAVGCDYPPPRVPLPVFSMHRACSIVCCDEAQRRALDQSPGYDVLGFMARLRGEIGARDVTDVIIDGTGTERSACTPAPLCTEAIATLKPYPLA